MIKNKKTQKNEKYEKVLISLNNDPADKDMISSDNISLKNKINIFLRPFEHKAVAVKLCTNNLKNTLDILDKDIYITINDRFSRYLRLDDCTLRKNTSCIHL